MYPLTLIEVTTSSTGVMARKNMTVVDGHWLQNWLLQSVTMVQFLSLALPGMHHVGAWHQLTI